MDNRHSRLHPSTRFKIPVLVRLRSMLVPEGECLVFTGWKERGYGRIRVNGKLAKAHRVWWLGHGRQIPDGLELDHLCRNRACVRLDHLESVPCRTNILRGVGPSARNAAKEYCFRGHLLSGDNVRLRKRPHGKSRVCKQCAEEYAEEYNRRRRMMRHMNRPLLSLYRLYTDSAGTTVRSERRYTADGKVHHRSITTGPGRTPIVTAWTVIGKHTARRIEVTRRQKLAQGWVET